MLLVGEENTIAENENSVEVNKYFDVTQWKVKENYSDAGKGREEYAFMIALINHTVCISPGLELGWGEDKTDSYEYLIHIFLNV